MRVHLVLILAVIGCVKGQITLGERRRGTVDKICRTFCPNCSPSYIGETSSETTEYCRRNPTALSCELARIDPERAVRIFQDNQWAFIRGGPSNEEEPAGNENLDSEGEETTATIGGGINQQGTNQQGGRPTGDRNGGTFEERTTNTGGGSSSVVPTGGGSQGVVPAGGGSGGREWGQKEGYIREEDQKERYLQEGVQEEGYLQEGG
ncbi:uncharacterized protein LOC144860494 [Branchiostoma floridae x Branchiostoma japonicum]